MIIIKKLNLFLQLIFKMGIINNNFILTFEKLTLIFQIVTGLNRLSMSFNNLIQFNKFKKNNEIFY